MAGEASGGGRGGVAISGLGEAVGTSNAKRSPDATRVLFGRVNSQHPLNAHRDNSFLCSTSVEKSLRREDWAGNSFDAS